MSQLASKLRGGRFPVLLEITPPREPRQRVLLRRARLLGDRADAVNVIHRPDRVSSLEASLILASEGIEPVWHLINRGRGRDGLREEISNAARGGLHAVLCIRGDHAASDVSGTPKIREVVPMVLEAIPDALVGVTMNQFAPRDRVLTNLIPKLRAGATFVQSQPVFSIEGYRELAQEVRSRVPRTLLVPMLMPLVSAEAAERVRARLGAEGLEDLVERLRDGGEAAGWKAFSETLQWLSESGLADGVSVMTLEMDPPSALVRRFVRAVDRVREARG
jgi:5,10-methylenetetrahydrofolate reductase